MGTIIGDGITFDDVLLVPQYSEVTPNMIELTTHLTKKIVLNIPMMSAAMDTVTEHRIRRKCLSRQCPRRHPVSRTSKGRQSSLSH